MSNRAWASLGDRVDSVEKDRSNLQAERAEPELHKNYSVHQITSSSMVVREYASRSTGKVFAISWTGRSQPSLNALLGSYADDFKTILRAAGRRRFRSSRQRFRNEKLVVESSGHLGFMQGLAYAPELIPTNVSLDEIK
jgi:hypothetical protein